MAEINFFCKHSRAAHHIADKMTPMICSEHWCLWNGIFIAALADVWWSINKNGIKIQTFHDFNTVIGSACFVISIIEYICPLNCVHYWVWVSNKDYRHSPILTFKHVILWCLKFDPHLTTPIEYNSPILKSHQITPAYLSRLDVWVSWIMATSIGIHELMWSNQTIHQYYSNSIFKSEKEV